MSHNHTNRYSITFKQKDIYLGIYRPNDELFFEIQKMLKPYRFIYKKNIKSKNAYSVILKDGNVQIGSYKISSEKYHFLIEKIQEYRSFASQAKKVKCIETGQIFENARQASIWAASAKKTSFCNMQLIKQCCRGKQKTSYGYHWEFIEDINEIP